MCMSTENNNFKADILREIGVLPISNTQEYRVLLVRDPELGIRVSLQKWWRKSKDETWNAGKGFFLDGRECIQIGRWLQEIGSEIIHVKN